MAPPAAEVRHDEARIPSLDGLRAIAISLVCLGHLTWNQHLLGQNGQYLKVGDLGVRIFFVLSGFLITSILLRELETHSTISLARFYFRRTLRIFPAFYAFVVIMITVNAVHWVQLYHGSAISPVSYAADYVVPGKRVFGHTWSLAVEEQFYLLWPATLLFLGRRRALWLAGLMLLGCPVMRVVSFVLMAHHASVTALIQDPRFRFDTQADALAIGCLLAGLRGRLHGHGWYRGLLASRALALVPVLGLVAGELGNTQLQTLALPHLVGGYGATNLAIALSLDWCLTYPSGAVGGFLNAAPVATVGVLSYSIYLWQEPFLYISRSGWWHQAPANLALTLIAATASYLLIERPCLRLRSRWERSLFGNPSATMQWARLGRYHAAIRCVPLTRKLARVTRM
jgi:peptidoglycan/LPS O-acetylase OafA/YrhL